MLECWFDFRLCGLGFKSIRWQVSALGVAAVGVVAHTPGEDLFSTLQHCGEDLMVLQDFSSGGGVKRLLLASYQHLCLPLPWIVVSHVSCSRSERLVMCTRYRGQNGKPLF